VLKLGAGRADDSGQRKGHAMTDHRSTPAPPDLGLQTAAGAAPNHSAAGDGAELTDPPLSWFQAEADAPHSTEPWTPPRRTRITAVPIRREGPAIAYATAIAGGFVAGSGWYFADVLDEYSGPWTPIAAAILIGVPVRLFSRADPSQRSLASVATYLVVLVITLMALTHHDLAGTYGPLDDYRIYEDSVIRTRLRDPLHLSVYLLGGLLAAALPRLGTRR
jgi:hypothetical protein